MFDIIGDIHGHADELELLLKKLDYTKKKGVYSHPERKVLFVGDYIDRGPKIRETLEIVKSMTDNESAIALMGNHEYNALCFDIKHPSGGHLRPHLIKNIDQHYKTLKAFHGNQDEFKDYLTWLKSLPLYYENEQFRAVHACWNEDNIHVLKSISGQLSDQLIYESTIEGTIMFRAFDQTLKGIELKLPDGMSWEDHEKNKRQEIRTRWWENPRNMSYRDISVENLAQLPDIPVNLNDLPTSDYYHSNKPVFFGHYWLKGTPEVLKENVCCLDYSIAKGGKLVAYRFQEAGLLETKNLVYI
jgi:hypothetical protein